MAPTSIQELIDHAVNDAVVELLPGNYGPVELRRAVVLNGHGATFWSTEDRPAMRITAAGVCLQNLTLRPGLNAGSSVVFEVASAAHPALQSVRVQGEVSGIDHEEEKWVLPKLLDGGDLRAPVTHFTLELGTPGPARLVCRVSGVEFDPPQLKPGFNEVQMRIRDVSQDSILIGDVELIASQLTRIIPFFARVSQFAPGVHSAPVRELCRIPEGRRGAHSVRQAETPSPVAIDIVRNPAVSSPTVVAVSESVIDIPLPDAMASPVASPSSKSPLLPDTTATISNLVPKASKTPSSLGSVTSDPRIVVVKSDQIQPITVHRLSPVIELQPSQQVGASLSSLFQPEPFSVLPASTPTPDSPPTPAAPLAQAEPKTSKEKSLSRLFTEDEP